MRNAYKFLFRRPEGKRLHGQLRHTWEDNIKMDIKGTLDLSRSRLRLVVGSCEHGNNLWVPQEVGNFLTSRATVHFSRRDLLCGVTLKMRKTYQSAWQPHHHIMKKRFDLFYVFRVLTAITHGIHISQSI
jgi:hypothetical protein